MKDNSINIEGIGEVKITRRKGSKRFSMRVKPDGTVSVNYPWYAAKKEVTGFIEKNITWIKDQQKKIEANKQLFELDQTIPTRFHFIKIVSVEKGKIQAVRKNGEVILTIPSDQNIALPQIQEFIKKVVTEICRIDSKQYLPERTLQLAKQHGFSFNKVFIKNLKSKWGSCSSNLNINFNLHLIRLPDHLIDYIILHELCHTKEMNHGEGFWALMNKVSDGKAKLLDKEMKKQNQIILR